MSCIMRCVLQRICIVILLFHDVSTYQPVPSVLWQLCPARLRLHGRFRDVSVTQFVPCSWAICSSPSLRMMDESSLQRPQDDHIEPSSPQTPKPHINWKTRLKKALDMNPGRSERLSKQEQEGKYQEALTANPRDVDALCRYACFLSTKSDYVGAVKLYKTAMKTDPNFVLTLYVLSLLAHIKTRGNPNPNRFKDAHAAPTEGCTERGPAGKLRREVKRLDEENASLTQKLAAKARLHQGD